VPNTPGKSRRLLSQAASCPTTQLHVSKQDFDLSEIQVVG